MIAKGMHEKVELHIVQNFAPSCLNRDDANAPKDCEFGGFRRARISSQCIKRAVRWHPEFRDRAKDHLAIRTRRITEHIAEQVAGRVGADQAEVQPIVDQLIAAAVVKMGKGTETSVLLFLGHDEIERIIATVADAWPELAAAAQEGDKALKEKVKAVAKDIDLGTKSVDVALFGRMIAEQPKWNIEAACQVAHAISTHAVDMEMDFYTAVDDLNPEEEPGAGMMGVIEYNSACFYRYSLLDWPQLLSNLGGDVDLARTAIEGYLRASILAIPTGKQNSMAAHNLPAFIFAVVRSSGAPISLANAFEKPVWVSQYDRDKGLVEKSIERLDAAWGAHKKMYGVGDLAAEVTCWLDTISPEVTSLPEPVGSIDDLVATVMDALPGNGGG